MPNWSAEIKKLCLCISLAVFINAFSIHTLKGDNLINSYDIYLEINPNNQSITAEIKLDLNLLNSGNDTLIFFLHNELSIKSIESGHSLSYDFLKDQECPYFYMKNARPLKIIFEQEYNDNVIIHIKYQGPVKDIAWGTTNMLTTNWIELGTYSAWFPYNPEYGNFRYRIDLLIEDGYKVSGMGEIKKLDNRWEITQDYPSNDIVIIASRTLKSFHYPDEQYQIRIDYLLARDEKAKELAEDAKIILELYNDWFPSKGGQLLQCCSQSPVQNQISPHLIYWHMSLHMSGGQVPIQITGKTG